MGKETEPPTDKSSAQDHPQSGKSKRSGGGAALPGSHLLEMVRAGTTNSHWMRAAERGGALGIRRRQRR